MSDPNSLHDRIRQLLETDPARALEILAADEPANPEVDATLNALGMTPESPGYDLYRLAYLDDD